MTKTLTARDASTTDDPMALLRAVRGETIPYRQAFESIARKLSCQCVLAVTLLPRGALQLAQAYRWPDQPVRLYEKRLQSHDRLGWQAIIRGEAIRSEEAWPAGAFAESPYNLELMRPSGYQFAAAAPIEAPVLDGYPGALVVYRTAEQGAFASAELAKLRSLAAEMGRATNTVRAARRRAQSSSQSIMRKTQGLRIFIFNPQLEPVLGAHEWDTLDASLRIAVLDVARSRFGHLVGRHVAPDRVSLPGARGDLWNFRVSAHAAYPAIGPGAFIIFALQPNTDDFGLIRGGDFAADPELVRLIPALKFMEDHFHRRPNLRDIAKVVHLSPFHFHRRFTEMLGITPKHFLLDCQIRMAKAELMSKRKDLVKIAASCGFAHQSHFTSRFRQATGFTPTRWRRDVAAGDA